MQRSSEADPVTNALWEQQQHLWSKSVPHQLHGLERGTNDVIPTTLASILSHQLNVNASNSSAVPNTDRFECFDSAINPSIVTEPSSFQLVSSFVVCKWLSFSFCPIWLLLSRPPIFFFPIRFRLSDAAGIQTVNRVSETFGLQQWRTEKFWAIERPAAIKDSILID